MCISSSNSSRAEDSPPQNLNPEYLTSDEDYELLDHLISKGGSSALYDVIALLLNTGLRIGEAAQLRWSDADLESRKLSVPQPAANPVRSISDDKTLKVLHSRKNQ